MVETTAGYPHGDPARPAARAQGQTLHYAALAAILAVAAALRFAALSDKGLIYWDEGQQALESIFMLNAPGMLPDVVSPHTNGEIPSYFPGVPLIFGRPSFDLLLAVSMALFGRQDLAVLAVSAGIGTLTVLAVYLIGRDMFSPAMGLLSAGILALLPYHVFYSRDARADAAAAFFAVVGLWAYYRCWGGGSNVLRWRAMTGLILGIGFTVQNRLYVLVPVLVAQELVSMVLAPRRPEPARWMREVATTVVAGLVPLLAWEVLYRLLLQYAKSQGQVALPFQLYSQQVSRLFGTVTGVAGSWPQFSDAGFYGVAFWHLGSGVILALALFGLVAVPLSRLKIHAAALTAIQFWLVFVFLALLPAKAPRYLGAFLPAAAMLAAYGLYLLWRSGRWRAPSRVLASFLVAVALLNGVSGWSQAFASSGTPGAVTWLTAKGAGKYLSPQRPPVQFYSGRGAEVLDPGRSIEELSIQYARGFKYVLIDDQAYLDEGSSLARLAGQIERSVPPAYEVLDGGKDGPMFYLEHSEWLIRSSQEMLSRWAAVREERGPAAVKVYDLGAYLATRK